MKHLLFSFILLSCTIFGENFSTEQHPETEMRAAIDVGSGATRMKVAKVDLKSQKIVSIIFNRELSVPYQENLTKSSDGTFDAEVESTGLSSIQYFKDAANYYGVKKIVGVATAAFRSAKNAEELTNNIHSLTGVKVHIIDQELEGVLAFNAVAANMSIKPENMLVWDIGGGSLQFTAKERTEDCHVYKSNVGSIAFKDRVISAIQGKDPKVVQSPNPNSEKDIQGALVDAEQIAQDVDDFTKKKIHNPKTVVVGVGSLFSSIKNLIGKDAIFQHDLKDKIFSMAGMTDEELGGGPYANVTLTNMMYVLGMMQALDINPVLVEKVNNADGAMIYSPFW